MRQLLRMIATLALFAVLSGCGHDSMRSPCPNFGRYCQQEWINV